MKKRIVFFNSNRSDVGSPRDSKGGWTHEYPRL